MQLSFWGKILFTVFIMNSNKSYAAGCPKRTYLLNAHFVSMSTQAVCNSVAVILILKLCSERKRERKEGRKEGKKNYLDWVPLIHWPRSFQIPAPADLFQLCLSHSVLPSFINRPFPHGNCQHLEMRTVLSFSQGLPRGFSNCLLYI